MDAPRPAATGTVQPGDPVEHALGVKAELLRREDPQDQQRQPGAGD
jgi:hypothetical protein